MSKTIIIFLIRTPKFYSTEFVNPIMAEKAKTILSRNLNTTHSSTDYWCIKAAQNICNDLGVIECISKQREHINGEFDDYFLLHIDRICDPDYVPSNEDLIKMYLPTTKIMEHKIEMAKL